MSNSDLRKQSVTHKARILEVITAGARTVRAIVEDTTIKKGTVVTQLSRLVDSGILTNESGVYRLTSEIASTPSTLPVRRIAADEDDEAS
jgi:DNA-binding IclR family transcriptional regulator